MKPPLLSVVIVNFETPDYTLECIRSVYRYPPSCVFEVILLDNGSSDQSFELIQREFPKVVLIETGKNLGFAMANNRGIARSSGEYILFLNSDTKILDNSLDRLLRYLENNPGVGAIGPRQLDGNGRLQLSWGAFPTLISETYRKLLHYRLSVNDLRIRDYLEEMYSETTSVDWISGSCLMARRKALEEAGLFDDKFFMYFEDIDLCRRFRDHGWSIVFNSDTTLIHYGGVSAKRNLPLAFFEYRRSQIHFTRKYYGFVGVLVLKVLLFFKHSILCFSRSRRDASRKVLKLIFSESVF